MDKRSLGLLASFAVTVVSAPHAVAQVAVQQQEIVTCPATLAIGAYAAKLPKGWTDQTGASVTLSQHRLASDGSLFCYYGDVVIGTSAPANSTCTADTSTPRAADFICRMQSPEQMILSRPSAVKPGPAPR